jgi:hypothetical protein
MGMDPELEPRNRVGTGHWQAGIQERCGAPDPPVVSKYYP